jgi:lipopolysaccharide heptosyltransferase II
MKVDWKSVNKVLVIRLRSIGDTVLSTPTLRKLREALPHAKIDVLLEDWVAPVLEGFNEVDEIITVSKSLTSRVATAHRLRKESYDVVLNLHGGTTSGLITRATGAKYRIGYAGYQYAFLYNRLAPPASEFWQRAETHSAEQQIALLGLTGLPVDSCPKTNLTVNQESLRSVEQKLHEIGISAENPFVLIHPAAAYETKRWSSENFASVIRHAYKKKFAAVLVARKEEARLVEDIDQNLERPALSLLGLSLPEVTALASRAALFVGNDSGIAHIAAAVDTPTVVIFGSSNSVHWKPWTSAPNRVVRIKLDCQPCPGDKCRVFERPRCILDVGPEPVCDAIDEIISF